MGIFDSPEEKKFYRLRRTVIKELFRQYNEEKNPYNKILIEAMARSVAFTPVEVFSNRKVLVAGVEKIGKTYSFFEVKGRSLISFMEKITPDSNKMAGVRKEILVANKIQIGNLWNNPDAFLTLFHEFAHNAKLHLENSPQAQKLMPRTERQEEEFADTLAIYTAEKLGFPNEIIVKSLRGRKAIIGIAAHKVLTEKVEQLGKKRGARNKTVQKTKPPLGFVRFNGKLIRIKPPIRRHGTISNVKGPKWTMLTFPRIPGARMQGRPRSLIPFRQPPEKPFVKPQIPKRRMRA